MLLLHIKINKKLTIIKNIKYYGSIRRFSRVLNKLIYR